MAKANFGNRVGEVQGLPEFVLEFCRKNQLIEPTEPLVVAVSGGADSVALLFLLKDIFPGLPVTVAHYNHRWRGAESDQDEVFVKALADRLGLPFVSGQAPRDYAGSGQSEAEARADRYCFLEQTALAVAEAEYALFHRRSGSASPDRLPAVRIALAHHREDRAETVLLNLLRGSAVRGLAGIRPRQNRLVRPLLKVSPVDLKAYLLSRGESWRHDSSNDCAGNKRNALRLDVIPLLNQYSHGSLTDRLLAAADAAALDDCCLEDWAGHFFEEHVRPDFFLPLTGSEAVRVSYINVDRSKCQGAVPVAFHFPLTELAALPSAVLRRVIRRTYEKLVGQAVDLLGEQIASCEEQIRCAAEENKKVKSRGFFDLRAGVFYGCHQNDVLFARKAPNVLGLSWLSSYACGWHERLFLTAPAGSAFQLKSQVLSTKPTGDRTPGSAGYRPSTGGQAGSEGGVQSLPDRKSGFDASFSLILDNDAKLSLDFINIEKEDSLDYNCTLWTCFSCPLEHLTALCCRRPGDSLVFPDDRKKPLKKVLNDMAVPRLWRERLLFGTDGSDLYGALGLNLFGRFTKNIKIIVSKQAKLETDSTQSSV